MSTVERSFEAWEEVQRHGQDLADRLAQGFTGLIQSHMTPPSFSWPNPPNPKLFDLEFPPQSFVKPDFGLSYPPKIDSSAINGIGSIFDIGNRIGQAGADFGNCLNGFLQQFFRGLPVPFRHEESVVVAAVRGDSGAKRERIGSDLGVNLREEVDLLGEKLRDFGFVETDGKVDGSGEEYVGGGFSLRGAGQLGRPQVCKKLFLLFLLAELSAFSGSYGQNEFVLVKYEVGYVL